MSISSESDSFRLRRASSSAFFEHSGRSVPLAEPPQRDRVVEQRLRTLSECPRREQRCSAAEEIRGSRTMLVLEPAILNEDRQLQLLQRGPWLESPTAPRMHRAHGDTPRVLRPGDPRSTAPASVVPRAASRSRSRRMSASSSGTSSAPAPSVRSASTRSSSAPMRNSSSRAISLHATSRSKIPAHPANTPALHEADPRAQPVRLTRASASRDSNRCASSCTASTSTLIPGRGGLDHVFTQPFPQTRNSVLQDAVAVGGGSSRQRASSNSPTATVSPGRSKSSASSAR